MSDVPTLEVLSRYRGAGLVSERTKGPLSIFNYRPRVQYEGLWDEVTTKTRGLIINCETGEVVARPWDKFFNHGEPCAPAPPDGPFHLTSKLDGSLVILYEDEHGLHWATRGSFDSPQAAAANRIRRPTSRPGSWTVLGEVLAPESRVVVNYAIDEVVILGARDRFTGEEVPWDEVCEWAESQGFPMTSCAWRSDLTMEELRKAADLYDDQVEGYVVHWPNAGVRLKVKGKAYRASHALLGRLTERRIGDHWYASPGKVFLPLGAPDAARDLASKVIGELSEERGRVLAELQAVEERWEKEKATEYAQYALEHAPALVGALMQRFRRERHCDVDRIVYQRLFGKSPREVTP